jgi:hypothetical protein
MISNRNTLKIRNRLVRFRCYGHSRVADITRIQEMLISRKSNEPFARYEASNPPPRSGFLGTATLGPPFLRSNP